MRWPPYRHVVFDCDSTLTRVEGIDVLAARAGLAEEVARLTEAAMEGVIDLEDVYGERLAAVGPTRAEVAAIRHDYKEAAVPDARRVVEALHELGHDVYIVSGGLEEPVREFGISLGVPADRIRAVGVAYDELSGQWWSRHQGQERYLDYGKGALAMSEGKAQIIGELVGDERGRRLMIGDGVSDLLAAEAVDLFIGYGGVADRPRVRVSSPIYLHDLPLSPIVPLAAGPSARDRLTDPAAQALFDEGLDGALAAQWNDGSLESAFRAAAEAADKV